MTTPSGYPIITQSEAGGIEVATLEHFEFDAGGLTDLATQEHLPVEATGTTPIATLEHFPFDVRGKVSVVSREHLPVETTGLRAVATREHFVFDAGGLTLVETREHLVWNAMRTIALTVHLPIEALAFQGGDTLLDQWRVIHALDTLFVDLWHVIDSRLDVSFLDEWHVRAQPLFNRFQDSWHVLESVGTGSLMLPSISAPWGLTPVLTEPGAGGVWGSTGQRAWVVTAINANGETGPSNEATLDVDDVTKGVVLTWQPIQGADAYRVYRRDEPGMYGASSFLAQVTDPTYTDLGSGAAPGTPPTNNTTGGPGPGTVTGQFSEDVQRMIVKATKS